jgi:hypothetical protein
VDAGGQDLDKVAPVINLVQTKHVIFSFKEEKL